MAAANRTWGEERIANELLLKLGIRLSPRTVRRYMPSRPRRPKPETQAWSTFVRNHASSILASDFFIVVTATFRILYVFVVLEVGTRRIAHWNVTAHPTAEWTAQQFRMIVRNDQPQRFVIHDRDTIYSEGVDRTLDAMGLTVLKTPGRAPQANAFCERVIGTIRRECLDFMILMSERHVRATLREWLDSLLAEDGRDRPAPHVVTQIRERASNARVPPIAILHRHPHHQLSYRRGRRWPPGSAPLMAVILACDEMAMPGEQGVRAHDRSELLEHASADAFRLGGQADTLVVGEPETTRTELLSEDTILGLKIVNHLALLLVDPSGERHEQEAQRLRHQNHWAEPIKVAVRRHPLAEARRSQWRPNFWTLRGLRSTTVEGAGEAGRKEHLVPEKRPMPTRGMRRQCQCDAE